MEGLGVARCTKRSPACRREQSAAVYGAAAPLPQVVMQTRIAFLVSNAVELTIFFAAAAALSVGLLGLR